MLISPPYAIPIPALDVPYAEPIAENETLMNEPKYDQNAPPTGQSWLLYYI